HRKRTPIGRPSGYLIQLSGSDLVWAGEDGAGLRETAAEAVPARGAQTTGAAAAKDENVIGLYRYIHSPVVHPALILQLLAMFGRKVVRVDAGMLPDDFLYIFQTGY